MFGASLQIEKMTRLYQSVDWVETKYGKHTLFLASSFYAHANARRKIEQRMLPERKLKLLRGETFRRRMAIQMLGVVVG